MRLFEPVVTKSCGTLLAVEIGPHRDVGRRADLAIHQQHLVLLDEAAGLLDRLGRAVAVVERDEIDLAPVDAALVVDHGEIAGHLALDRAGRRDRARKGPGIAELDLGVGRAGIVFAGRKRRRGERQRQNGGADQMFHCSLPGPCGPLAAG